jgi:hypothetical protein
LSKRGSIVVAGVGMNDLNARGISFSCHGSLRCAPLD